MSLLASANGAGGPRERRPTILRLELRLSRVTSSGYFLPEIDGFRFIAIYLVVLHHSHFFLHDVIPTQEDLGTVGELYRIIGAAGGVGVPIFFVISGFILGLPFAAHHLAGRPPVDLWRYFKRRLRRLEPPYVINLTLLLAWMSLSGGWDRVPDLAAHYFASIFYLHNTIYDSWSEINFVAWSLEIEAQFYLLAPLAAVVFVLPTARTRRGWILAAIIAGCVVHYLASDGPFRLLFSILALGQFFLAGFLLADLKLSGWLDEPRSPALNDVLAAVCLLAAVFFHVGLPHDALRSLLVLPVFGFFYFGLRSWLLLSALRFPAVYLVGGMCYTIYLYHFWISAVVVDLFGLASIPANIFTLFALDVALFAAATVASVVPFLLFERPFMFGSRSRAKANASAATGA